MLSPVWEIIRGKPLKLGLKMLEYQHENQEEQKAWEMWLTKYPDMDKTNFVPFAQFYKDIKAPIQPEHKETAEELLKKAREIRTKIRK